MKLLLLGGTRFLGRAIAVEALARGMEVTCLARGTSAPPDGVTFVRADRNDDIALSPVSQQHWDAVIDVSMQPGQVRRAVRDLSTDHVVIISTSSVYATGDRLEQDEDAPILAALDGDIMTDMSTYGPAKVACEEAVRASTVTSTIIRSGLIGGPGDTSGRSGYYPWRFAHPTGEDVLVPDDPDFPCALIDVDDLAAWAVTAAQNRIAGTFNATGPTTPLANVLETAPRRRRASAPATTHPRGDPARSGRPVLDGAEVVAAVDRRSGGSLRRHGGHARRAGVRLDHATTRGDARPSAGVRRAAGHTSPRRAVRR